MGPFSGTPVCIFSLPSLLYLLEEPCGRFFECEEDSEGSNWRRTGNVEHSSPRKEGSLKQKNICYNNVKRLPFLSSLPHSHPQSHLHGSPLTFIRQELSFIIIVTFLWNLLCQLICWLVCLSWFSKWARSCTPIDSC